MHERRPPRIRRGAGLAPLLHETAQFGEHLRQSAVLGHLIPDDPGDPGVLRDQIGMAECQEHRRGLVADHRSEEHTSALQSLMRISYAVFCLKKKKNDKLYI